LKTPGEFRRVFRSGQRLDGPLFQLVAAENGGSHHRLGLTVGRKVGAATARNRAKRLLRESFRRHAFAEGVSFDIVVVPKRELAERSQAEVDREYEDRLRRLAERRRAPNRRPHPSSRG
jgi:ribonuclease P protein component